MHTKLDNKTAMATFVGRPLFKIEWSFYFLIENHEFFDKADTTEQMQLLAFSSIQFS